MADQKKDNPPIVLPEARVINNSLFEKDIYEDERGNQGTPSYKIELAFDPATVQGEGLFDEMLAEHAVATWGEPAWNDFFDGRIRSPFIDGDFIASKRAEKGKAGDAYKGKLVLRTHTLFNKDGVNGPGGIQVYDPDCKLVTVQNQGVVYNGCFGQVAVTIDSYTDSRTGQKCLMTYLAGFQKTRDGDRLATARDLSQLFKPVGRPAAADGAAPARARRRG